MRDLEIPLTYRVTHLTMLRLIVLNNVVVGIKPILVHGKTTDEWHTSGIRIHTSDIIHTNDIRVHTNKIRVTYR